MTQTNHSMAMLQRWSDEESRAKLIQGMRDRTGERRRLICQLASEGVLVKEISVRSATTVQNVNRILFRGGVKPVRVRYRRTATEQDVLRRRTMEQRYSDGVDVDAIALEMGISRARVQTVLKEAGFKLIFKHWNANPERIAAIVKMGMDGVSHNEIAQHFQITTCRVSDVLCDHGIRMKYPKEKRADGYSLDSQGYLWTRIGDDDPMASMRLRNGTISVHRLVMARQLGRPLLKTESVHHINGVRDDYRPENLELRQGKHGTGVVMCCLECGSRKIGHCPLT